MYRNKQHPYKIIKDDLDQASLKTIEDHTREYRMMQDNKRPYYRHGILHKPSASIKFYPKSFHKNSVISDIFAQQIMPNFDIFRMTKCAILSS